MYGLIISQYGDDVTGITVPGESGKVAIKSYIESHFGYDPNFIGPVAGVLVGFASFFALMFAYCLKTLNFQMR